ncbi:glycosyltransferase [Cyclobacterium sp.]|uniref:glycosyltransferase n=1 Tax=Cyclobacterium sp. TaxID=1966343 RepID=UPI0019ABDD80|nr:glycosyltransferase [Cyclobacterium sp.]MBD3627494.1 glycosyltransferase family 2 protein [Cyclobacterium sp.]
MKGVSIVICTYNGKSRLIKTLDYIQNLVFDQPWELVVVDNASTDGTEEFVMEYLENWSNSTVLTCDTPGKNFALWVGFRNIKYEYVLICDDDNYLFPNYLQVGYQLLEDHEKVGALGGNGLVPENMDFPDWLIPLRKTLAIGPQGKKNGRIPNFVGLYGAGCFFRKSALDKLIKLGYFTTLTCRKGDSNLISGGDIELCLAVQEIGYELWYESSLFFYHAIEYRRLTKKYIVNLRKSQASNFPILESYKFKRFSNTKMFKKYLRKKHLENLKKMVLAILSYLKNGGFEKRLQIEVFYSMVRSYYINLQTTIDSFDKLNRQLK